MRRSTTATAAALGTCGIVLAAQFLAAAPAAADGGQGHGHEDLRHDQWGLEAVKASKAWERNRGGGVTVAVLDTGVDGTHPDLRDSVTAGPDLTGEGGEPGDDGYGEHGTQLAGIIAASGHGRDQDGGVMGVAPDAKILSVRVATDSDDASGADTLPRAIRAAVAEGAQVITLPAAGSDEPGKAEQQAIAYAVDSGALVVVPGGGSYPAEDGVLAVGAVDTNLRLTAGSGRPDGVDLTAPGQDVATTAAGGGYTKASGPTAAAAFAAGAAALVRAEYPQLLPDQVATAVADGAGSAGGGSAGQDPGVLSVPGALEAAEKVAKDVPLYDKSLVKGEDEPTVPAWVLWTGGAVLVVLLVTVGIVVLRRSTANPYGFPEREDRRPQRRRAPRKRRGSRRKAD